MKKGFVLLLITFALTGLLAPREALAACVNPAGNEGNQVYNTTYKTMQFCDGNTWISMKGGVGTDALHAMSCADGEVIKWNDGATAWECATDSGLGAESDPTIDAKTSGKWCRGTGSQVTCDQDAPSGGLANPPVCNLSNRALQWDGSNWSCVIIAGSGGPPIVNGDHTQQECIDAGGTINTTEFGGDILCTFSGNGCPSGWTAYGRWKRTSKTCSGECSASGWTCTLPAGWITTNGSRSCSYVPTVVITTCRTTPFVNPTNCTQSAGEGLTDTACY